MIGFSGFGLAAGDTGPTGPQGPTGPGFECRCNYSEYYITDGTFTTSTDLNTVDSSTGEIVDSLPLTAGPLIAGDPGNGLLYVGTQDRTQIYVVDPKTQSVAALSLPLTDPYFNNFAIDPELRRLYVFEASNVLVYDTDTNEQIDSFSVSGAVAFSTPTGLVDPATHNLVLFFGGYPTNCGTVAVLTPTGSFVASNPSFCGGANDAAISPDGLTLYSIASNLLSPDGNLHILDLTDGTASAEPLPDTNIQGVGVDSRNGLVYLADTVNGLYVYNPSTAGYSGPHDVGSFGSVTSRLGMVFDANENQLLIRSTSLLKIINPNTLALVSDTPSQVPAGNFQRPAVLIQSDPCCSAIGATGPTGPTGPAGECGCCKSYAVAATAEGVSLIDPFTQEIARSIPVSGAQKAVLNQARGELYVARGANGLDILSMATGAVLAHFSEPADDIVFNPANNKLYATDNSGQQVNIYSVVTRAVLNTIPVSQPSALLLDPSTNTVYVGSGNSLIKIGGASNGNEGSVSLGAISEIRGAAIDPVRRRVFYTAYGDFQFHRLDLATGTIANGNIGGSSLGGSVAVNPAADRVYIGRIGANDVQVWNGTTMGTVMGAGVPLGNLAVDSANNLLYSAYGAGQVAVADTITGAPITSVAIGQSVNGITVAECPSPAVPTGPAALSTCAGPAYALVADQNGYLSVIDPRTHDLADTVPVGTVPYGVAVDPGLGLIYVTDDTEQVLYSLDARTYAVVSIAPLPNYSRQSAIPHFPAVNLSNHMVYVPNFESNSVSVFDGTALREGSTAQFDLITVENMPTAAAVNPRANRIYVANTGSGSISVINGNTGGVVATVPIPNAGGGVLTDVVADPCCTNLVFVAGYHNEITVIDGITDEVTGRLGTGGAYALALDTSRGLLYAIDDSRADVSVFDICSGKQVAQIPLPDTNAMLSRLTVDASNHLVYATDESTDSVYVIDGTTQSLLSNVNLGVGAMPMGAATLSCQECGCGCGAAGPEECTLSGNVYALQSNEIGVIDPNTHEEVSAIGLNPSIGGLPPLNDFAYNPSNGQFYVATNDALFIFDAQGSEIDRVLLETSFDRVVYNPTANKIYAVSDEVPALYIFKAESDWDQLNAHAVDAGTVLAVDPVTNQVYAGQPDGDLLVVYGTDNSYTSIFNAHTALLAVDTAHHLLYQYGEDGYVRIFDTRTNSQIDSYYITDSLPRGMAVNPDANRLYFNFGDSIEISNAETGNVDGTISGLTDVTSMSYDPLTNQLYIYDDGTGDTSIYDGRGDNFLSGPLGSIAMNPVIGFAPGTSEECAPDNNCPGIFVAGDTSGRYVFQFADYVSFDTTQIDLGNLATTSDGTFFRIRMPGVYEINVRVPLRSQNGDYVFHYALLVNGSHVFRDERNGSGAQEFWNSGGQAFVQLNAGDEIAVQITEYFNGDEFADTFENLSLAIRKIC